jgi:hypothetical protein
MKAFSLGGFEGVGGAWKMPPTDETFDAEMRARASMPWSVRFLARRAHDLR